MDRREVPPPSTTGPTLLFQRVEDAPEADPGGTKSLGGRSMPDLIREDAGPLASVQEATRAGRLLQPTWCHADDYCACDRDVGLLWGHLDGFGGRRLGRQLPRAHRTVLERLVLTGPCDRRVVSVPHGGVPLGCGRRPVKWLDACVPRSQRGRS